MLGFSPLPSAPLADDGAVIVYLINADAVIVTADQGLVRYDWDAASEDFDLYESGADGEINGNL